MYGDHSPERNPSWPKKALVIEKGDMSRYTSQQIWEEAESAGAVGFCDGVDVAVLVFEDNPRKAELFQLRDINAEIRRHSK